MMSKLLNRRSANILNTERYRYIIFRGTMVWNSEDLFGKPIDYVMSEVERRITEALVQDDRIDSCDSFEFEKKGRNCWLRSLLIRNLAAFQHRRRWMYKCTRSRRLMQLCRMLERIPDTWIREKAVLYIWRLHRRRSNWHHCMLDGLHAGGDIRRYSIAGVLIRLCADRVSHPRQLLMRYWN